jgi:hypothetical protein
MEFEPGFSRTQLDPGKSFGMEWLTAVFTLLRENLEGVKKECFTR